MTSDQSARSTTNPHPQHGYGQSGRTTFTAAKDTTIQRPDQPRTESTRSNIHDILSSEPSPRQIPFKRPASDIALSTSQSPRKRSRGESPDQPRLNIAAGRDNNDVEPEAYALTGSSYGANTVESDTRRRGSSSEGSLEADSSPSGSHRAGESRERLVLPPGITAPMLQKQRKRNFSNRTKTGCMTCRERKKKCDEGKPACLNCTRGGFQCKGYAQPGNTFRTTAGAREPLSSTEPAHAILDQRPPLSPNRAFPIQSHPSQYERSIPRLHHTSSEEDHRPVLREHAVDTSKQFPSHTRSTSGNDPRYDHTPRHTPRQSYPQPAPYPGPTHDHHSHDRRAAYEYDQHRAALPPHHVSHDPRALTHQAPPLGPPPNWNERDKMLNGWPFQPADSRLRAERDDCARRIQRFASTAVSADPGERSHILQSIFRPDEYSQHFRSHEQRSLQTSEQTHHSPRHAFPASPTPRYAGGVGRHVEIQSPFTCDYGSNIRIGHDVEIGQGCHIADSAIVDIGSRTILGPSVSILTTEPEPLLPGPGMKRLFKARGVVIGEDCFIGSGVMIMPGARIAAGSVVPPRSLVV